MYILYQAGGPIWGVGETKAHCLDDASEQAALLGVPLAADGMVLDVEEDFLDFTRLSVPGLEMDGELYLRRCTLALWDALQGARGASPPCRYVVCADGVVDVAPVAVMP